MSNKYYTSFYVDYGVLNYPTPNFNKPSEDKKVLAKLLADGPFLEWLNNEITEQTVLGTEDTKDSFKNRWNAYQLKRMRSKYLGIMNGMTFDDAFDDAINKLWISPKVKTPQKDGWYVVTIDGYDYGDEDRAIDVSKWSDGRWTNGENENEEVYAWLDIRPYSGIV